MHSVVCTNKAPKAIGPYSQALIAQGSRMIFISGQIPLDAESMKITSTDVREQTKVVLANLRAILDEAGAQIEHVVKTTLYIKNMDDFSLINQEYEKLFAEHKPARACVEVARLPRDVLVEIDAIAVL